MRRSMNFNQITPKQYLCAESPLWDQHTQTLCFTDIDGRSLHRLDPKSGNTTNVTMPGRVGCIAPTTDHGFIVAVEHEVYELDQNFRILRCLHKVDNASSDWRFNDGKCDRTGAYFWVGSIYLPRDKKSAGVWRLSRDGQFEQVIDNITSANGIAWSPDGRTMYVADSWHSTIWAYDYDPVTGDVDNKRLFFKTNTAQGRPDGATVDKLGYYWFAGYGGSRIIRLSPSGELDCEFKIQTPNPTMVSFGGKDMSTLFVTSQCDKEKIPPASAPSAAGSIFSAKTDLICQEEACFQLR